jgi:hypothetical protein
LGSRQAPSQHDVATGLVRVPGPLLRAAVHPSARPSRPVRTSQVAAREAVSRGDAAAPSAAARTQVAGTGPVSGTRTHSRPAQPARTRRPRAGVRPGGLRAAGPGAPGRVARQRALLERSAGGGGGLSSRPLQLLATSAPPHPGAALKSGVGQDRLRRLACLELSPQADTADESSQHRSWRCTRIWRAGCVGGVRLHSPASASIHRDAGEI